MAPGGVTVNVPDAPTREDAVAAVAELLEVVVDFPLTAADRSAWLAALLTPIARAAFATCPMFVFDAHTRGAGKSLLADCIGLIATGRRMVGSPWVQADEEMRKRVTSHAISGDFMILVDNVRHGATVGWPSLDGALTATMWEDRVLGTANKIRLPLAMVWYATGNNLGVAEDTSRRAIRIRLEPDCERPEDRSGFKHADLRAWIRAERTRLLTATLTVLRAYIAAGRPNQSFAPLGSFEGWSGIVRSAIAWAGQPDPVEKLAAADADLDPERASHVAFLLALCRADPNGAGLTAQEILDAAANLDKPPELRRAIAELLPTRNGELPRSKPLGNKLKKLRGRWREVEINGRMASLALSIKTDKAMGGRSRWRVTTMDSRSSRSSESLSAQRPKVSPPAVNEQRAFLEVTAGDPDMPF